MSKGINGLSFDENDRQDRRLGQTLGLLNDLLVCALREDETARNATRKNTTDHDAALLHRPRPSTPLTFIRSSKWTLDLQVSRSYEYHGSLKRHNGV